MLRDNCALNSWLNRCTFNYLLKTGKDKWMTDNIGRQVVTQMRCSKKIIHVCEFAVVTVCSVPSVSAFTKKLHTDLTEVTNS